MSCRWVLAIFLTFFVHFFSFSQHYQDGVIVVKIKKDAEPGNGRLATYGQSSDPFSELSYVVGSKPIISNKARNTRISLTSGLDRVYKLQLTDDKTVEEALAELAALDIIEYAEPNYYFELLEVPNDPQASPNGGAQNYLSVINAYDGWDIEKGDSSVIVGIIDTGIDLNHPDLQKNLYTNENDPINGIDDDFDGYVDNYYGWDVANNKSDPTAGPYGHGVVVTGFSNADTDNGTGIAGTGWNTKFMPVRIINDNDGKLYNSYEGIVYAVDMGCKVINLSWGGAGQFSQYGQDVIDYAVLDNDVVVIASAGNTAGELDFYPASFDNVISVGATYVNDHFASWATNSYHIDILAPGDNVYSTANGGGYARGTGTSFSGPLVAGTAALMRSKFPNFSALQIMEQLRVSAEDISHVGNNRDYEGRIGYGRLNVFNALTDSTASSIRINDWNYQGTFGELLFYGDTVKVAFQMKNYLKPTYDGTFTLSSINSGVEFLDDNFTIPVIETLEVQDVTDTLQFIIPQNAQPGERIVFRLDMNADLYDDYQYFSLNTTNEHFPIKNDSITLTVCGCGSLGYDSVAYLEGTGLCYSHYKIADHMGLILTSDGMVDDNAITDFMGMHKNHDFTLTQIGRLYNNGTADIDMRATYVPKDLSQLKISQKTLAWNGSEHSDYMIQEYFIANTTDAPVVMGASIFTDFNLDNRYENGAGWDPVDRVMYTVDRSDSSLWSGWALLSDSAENAFAIDKTSMFGNTADLGTAFTDAKKAEFATSGLTKTSAGVHGQGNDVAVVAGYVPFELTGKGSVKLAWALVVGKSLEELRQNTQLARDKYNQHLQNPPVLSVQDICEGNPWTFTAPVGKAYEVFQDPLMQVRLDSGSSFSIGQFGTDSALYLVETSDRYRNDIFTNKINISNIKADFSFSPDPVLIEQNGMVEVKFNNESSESNQWRWKLGNGYTSASKHPVTFYDAVGIYDLELIAENDLGCKDTIFASLTVSERLEKPIVGGQQICRGTSTVILASNSDSIAVYSSINLADLLYAGPSYVSEPLIETTDFYVVNVDQGNPSVPVKVSISVTGPESTFIHSIDTTDISSDRLMRFTVLETGDLNYAWSVEGNPIGNGSSMFFDYEGLSNFTVSLEASDQQGCSFTNSVQFSPKQSQSTSVISEVFACKNEEVTIEPLNGQVFFFYSESKLENLLHKGKKYSMTLLDSTTIYVVAMDSLLPGPSEIVSINTTPLKADFEMSHESVRLNSGTNVLLTDLSEHAVSTYWMLENGTLDPNPERAFIPSSAGEFQFSLLAIDESGCEDIATKTLKVSNITGVEDEQELLSIYPNPFTSELLIDLATGSGSDWSAKLISMEGKVLNEADGTTPQIIFKDLNTLEEGLYLLSITIDDKTQTFKVVKE